MKYGAVLIAVASLGLISASPSRQLPSMAQTADTAFMMGCNLHLIGASSIDEKNKSALEKQGIFVTEDGVPEDLRANSIKELGTPVFARMDSASGSVWISAYPNSAACTVTATTGETAQIFDEVTKSVDADGSFWRLVKNGSNISTGVLARTYKLSLDNGLKGGLMITATTSAAAGNSNKFALIAYRDN